MNWIADPSLIPPSGWVFVDDRIGIPVVAQSYSDLIPAAARQRKVNGVEEGDIVKDVNTYLCAKNPPNFCTDARGLGDMVAKITTAIGIPTCGGCARRRETLNQLVPL